MIRRPTSGRNRRSSRPRSIKGNPNAQKRSSNYKNNFVNDVVTGLAIVVVVVVAVIVAAFVSGVGEALGAIGAGLAALFAW
jgi:hypothetical protein